MDFFMALNGIIFGEDLAWADESSEGGQSGKIADYPETWHLPTVFPHLAPNGRSSHFLPFGAVGRAVN